MASVKDFARDTFHDADGWEIPKEKMLMFELADGGRVAVRGSGTEPKIKYYLFARREPPVGRKFTGEELAAIKPEVAALLEQTWTWLQEDAKGRCKPPGKLPGCGSVLLQRRGYPAVIRHRS